MCPYYSDSRDIEFYSCEVYTSCKIVEIHYTACNAEYNVHELVCTSLHIQIHTLQVIAECT